MLRELEALVATGEFGDVGLFSEVPVHRGGPSMLRAELLGMERLLRRSEAWAYFVYLSDSDYPLAPASDFGLFLRLHWPMSFSPVVYAFDEAERARTGRRFVVGRPDLRLRGMPSRRLVFECGGHAYTVQPELDYPASPGQLHGTGSFSVALERGFAEWLLAELREPDSLARRIYEDEMSLGQPDETFFQALLLNTPWCNRHVHSSLHYSWVDSRANPSYALPDSDLASLSPVVLTADSAQASEVREMLGSSGLELANATGGLNLHRSYFARKVRLPESARLLEEVDALLRAAEEPPWRSVRPSSRAQTLLSLATAWLAAHRQRLGDWAASAVEERPGPLGALAVRFLLRGPETAHLEVHERLALPAATPTHPRQLLGRVLLLRVAAIGAAGEGLPAADGLGPLVPARAKGLVVEAQVSPVGEACGLEVRWFDPRGALRASVPARLEAWQTRLRVAYPKGGPTRAGPWRVELAEAPGCQALGGVVAAREFHVLALPRASSDGKAGVPALRTSAAELDIGPENENPPANYNPPLQRNGTGDRGSRPGDRIVGASEDRYFDFRWLALGPRSPNPAASPKRHAACCTTSYSCGGRWL